MCNNEDPFTLKNAAELSDTWEKASTLQTQVPYKGVPQNFDISVHEPWDWAIENVIDDPMVSSYIVWDVQKHYRWTSTTWEQFVTKPWTGDDAWDAQKGFVNFKNAV
ncbi:hypothetical protein H2248_002082 [Termitomyces sp. 'cryptogamus']|nr:hypothetical protein H2248_002082 [Termitomyces sp. 'cryptogamus']